LEWTGQIERIFSMQLYLTILAIAILFLFLSLLFWLNRVIIFEYQCGLLYNNGKYVRTLLPGPHWHFPPWQSIQKVDMREFNITIPGQEVLSADNVSLKVSIAVGYKVTEPYIAINKVQHYQDALYQMIQLGARDTIGSLEVDMLLAKRAEIGKMLFEKTSEKAAALGLQLSLVDIKDIMFPGELKNIFAQVVNARKEGLAALERARGESAALRNLANTARLLDDNPNLRQLRLLQVLEKNSGNTVVIMPSDGISVINGKTDKRE
jgi:regulator of protease activity HflC (stomatin/prohibitin superfamily)